jgi:hypothetical protein
MNTSILRATCLVGALALFFPPTVFGQQVYWSQTSSQGLIGRVNADGTGSISVTSAQATFGMEALPSHPYVYWLDATSRTIRRANRDLSGDVPWVTGLPPNTSLNVAIDPAADLLVWTETSTNRLGRARLSDGAHLGTFASPAEVTEDVALDTVNQRIYWTTMFAGEVYSARYDGTDVNLLFTNTGLNRAISGIDLDLASGRMYVGIRDQSRIVRANLDGSDAQTVLTLPFDERPFGMDFFDGRLYWADWDQGRLRSARDDGTDLRTILGGLSSPRQVAVVPEPAAVVTGTCVLLALLVRVRRGRRTDRPAHAKSSGRGSQPDPLTGCDAASVSAWR